MFVNKGQLSTISKPFCQNVHIINTNKHIFEYAPHIITLCRKINNSKRCNPQKL